MNLQVQITTEFPFAPLLAHLSHPAGVIVSPKQVDEEYAAMADGKEPSSVINDTQLELVSLNLKAGIQEQKSI